MHPAYRKLFNAAFDDALFRRMSDRLTELMGEVHYRLAETPLILTPELRDSLVKSGSEILEQLSRPEAIRSMRGAVPPHYDVPGMDALPNTAQVDFALVESPKGGLEGKLIELQGFPSLYASMPLFVDAWSHAMRPVPGLEGPWGGFVGMSREQGLALLGRTLLGGCDPQEVVLVDIKPETQKTRSDFVATRKLFGIDAVCLTEIEVHGRALSRRKDGRSVPIKRIYNRVIFDELEAKNLRAPFEWTAPLDVSWCSHPNWFWIWSKYSLPHIDHPAAPRARLLSKLPQIPDDLSRYVLKPLFSFAGRGVVVDVTREQIDRVPAEQRDAWVLQEKIEYAPAITMPDGNGVKAEVRVMFARPPEDASFTPLLLLVRLSRGKMLGVDFNKDKTWVGGSVAIWPQEA